jgi:hypothetical protein
MLKQLFVLAVPTALSLLLGAAPLNGWPRHSVISLDNGPKAVNI